MVVWRCWCLILLSKNWLLLSQTSIKSILKFKRFQIRANVFSSFQGFLGYKQFCNFFHFKSCKTDPVSHDTDGRNWQTSFSLHFLSLSASCRIQHLDNRNMSKMFHHCAPETQPKVYLNTRRNGWCTHESDLSLN